MLQETIQFSGMSNSYSEFKGFYENELLNFSDSLDSAFMEASAYIINRSDNRVQRADVFSAMVVLGEEIKVEAGPVRIKML